MVARRSDGSSDRLRFRLQRVWKCSILRAVMVDSSIQHLFSASRAFLADAQRPLGLLPVYEYLSLL